MPTVLLRNSPPLPSLPAAASAVYRMLSIFYAKVKPCWRAMLQTVESFAEHGEHAASGNARGEQGFLAGYRWGTQRTRLQRTRKVAKGWPPFCNRAVAYVIYVSRFHCAGTGRHNRSCLPRRSQQYCALARADHKPKPG